jgi:hypothetical protein
VIFDILNIELILENRYEIRFHVFTARHYRSASLPLTTLPLATLLLIAITARVITAPNITNIQIFKNSLIEINLCYV